MTGICLPIDASGGSPSFPAAQHRAAQAALMGPQAGRPLGARSGVRAGAAPTITVTATQYTVTSFVAIVDPGTAQVVGPYLVAFLANEVGAITPADNANSRIDRLDVQVPDDPAGAVRAATVVYTQGVAGSGVAAAAPARSIPLGLITVPKASTGSPSFASSMSYAVASGGILPTTIDRPAVPYVGQYIDDFNVGMMRWDGTAWRPGGNGAVPAGGVTIAQTTGATGWQRSVGATAEDPAHPLQGGADIPGTVIRVPVTGYYQVTAAVTFTTGTVTTVGRRGVGVSPGTAASPSGDIMQDIAASNGAGDTRTVSGTMYLTAGTMLSAYRYTDVSGNYGAASATLRAVLLARV